MDDWWEDEFNEEDMQALCNKAQEKAHEQLNAMQHANLPLAMPPQPLLENFPPHNQQQNQPMPPHHIPASLPNTSNQFNVHQQENQPPKHPTKCSYSAIFSLQSLTHFLLKIGSHPSINDAFRGIMGANKVGSGSGQTHWAAPLSSYEAVRTVLDKLSKDPSSGLCISLKPLPELALRVLRISQAAHDDSELLTVLKRPTSDGQQCLWDRLMPFQRSGVQFGLNKGGRIIIGDEMGLGKTVQSLALLQCYRSEGPALIVCPSSLRGNWSKSLLQWLPDVTPEDIQVLWKKTDIKAEAKKGFVICSYDLLKDLSEDLMQRKFSFVCLDECHYIKSSNTKRTKAALPLCQKAKRVILLSGTPMLNRPDELASLLRAVLPTAHLRDREITDRYCDMDPVFSSKFIRAKNEEELHQLMQSVMIRRKKKEVLHELPSKRRQRIDLKLEAKELALVRDAPPEARYHQTAVAKIPAVKKYVEELLEDKGIKFLVFAHHTELLDSLEAQCKNSKAGFIRIDGSTPQQSRPQLVESFQTRDDIQVAILSIKAAGCGLTLTAASLVLFAELTFVPGEILQAEDRAHRIGQRSSVLLHFLMAKGTSDDRVWASIQGKLDDVGNILDGKGEQMEISRTSQGSQGSAALFAGKKRAADPQTSMQPETALPAAERSSEKHRKGIRDFFQPKPKTLPAVAEGDDEDPTSKKQKLNHHSINLT